VTSDTAFRFNSKEDVALIGYLFTMKNNKIIHTKLFLFYITSRIDAT
jgi:hypothetical protein